MQILTMVHIEDTINRRGNAVVSLVKNPFVFVNKSVVVLLLLFSTTVYAKKLELDAGINTEYVFTDNVDIAVQERESDSYLLFSPFVNIKSQGRRVNAYMDYRATGYMYAKNSGMNDMQHLLRGDLGIELIRDRFFTDFYVSRESEVIDAEDAISFDGLIYGANSTNKYTAQVKPMFVLPISGDLGAFYSSSHGKIIYDRGIDDVEEHDAVLSLGTASRSAFFNWNINSSFEYIKTEGFKASEYRQVDFTSSYPVFNRTIFYVMFGKKWERLSSSPSYSWFDGNVWNAKIAYSLSTRTKFELGGGEDLYGDTHLASIIYENDKTALSLSYSEKQVNRVTQDIEDQLADERTYKLYLGESDVYVQKKTHLTWNVEGVKNSIDLTLKYEDRIYRNIEQNEIFIGADIQWDYNLSSKSYIRANLRWWRLGDDLNDRLDDMSTYSLKYNRSISKKASWFTSVQAGIRDGTQAALEYKQAKFTVGAELKY